MARGFRNADEAGAVAREFALEVMRPAGMALDRMADPADTIAAGSPMWEVHREFRKRGLHLAMLPAAFGGIAESMPPGAMQRLHQELGYGDAGLGISLAASTMPYVFASICTDRKVRDLSAAYARDLSADMVGCWAITEPNHGSDWVLGTTPEGRRPELTPQLRAVKKGNEYIVNGQKASWVSNGTIATHAVLHMSLDPSRGMHGTGLAFCPLDLPGISRGLPLDKVGQRALNQGEIFFEDVKLPESHVIFSNPAVLNHDGFMRLFLGTANQATGVTMSGLALAAYDEAVAHAKKTTVGGRLLFEEPDVRVRLFNMFSRVAASSALALRPEPGRERGPLIRALARLGSTRLAFWVISRVVNHVDRNWARLTADGAWLGRRLAAARRSGALRGGRHGIATKIICTQTSFDVASEAMQIIGHAGLSLDHPIQKMLRDARASLIEDGTNEAIALAGSLDL